MKVALLGDIALFGKNNINAINWENRFFEIERMLDNCDFVIGNLETPLTDSSKTIGGKSACIKSAPENVEILKYLGITHVTLANNHMFDFRQQGLEDTINILDKHGIGWYGINGKSIELKKGTEKAVLFGYCCYSTNAKGMGKVNIFDPIEVEKDLKRVEGILSILSIHWGEEHVHYPNYDHVSVARKLCKNRKVCIHGHHPHVIQGIEDFGDSLIAYSLGNFCFDDIYTRKSKKPLIELSQDNKESYILILDINNSSIQNKQIVPFSFMNNTYIIDNTILPNIRLWSDCLCEEESQYNRKRSQELGDYINNRKSMRDLEWYIKRMNIESVKKILSSRYNKKRYNDIIKSYIE